MVDFPANILIVDDHPLFRSGLLLSLRRLGATIELHEASCCEEDIARHLVHAPFDLILIDHHPSADGGLACFKTLSQRFPDAPWVVLSDSGDLLPFDSGLCPVSYSQFPKSISLDQLLTVLSDAIKPTATRARPHRDLPCLTSRQRDVLVRVCAGQSNKAIACELLMSTNTVRVHLQNIFITLGVKTRTQAALLAKERGIV